ncbi:tumor necrosis factor receptor superfamily member 19L isoform X2 [Mobula birostris]|uniref:tumor necrosis factor receptor superfamily member 19L isoform X2 n=1 Tax=Mobula birostris TaxID=1983395 RepID=UPI003B2833C6
MRSGELLPVEEESGLAGGGVVCRVSSRSAGQLAGSASVAPIDQKPRSESLKMKSKPPSCTLFCYITLLTWQSIMMMQCGELEFEDSRGHCVPCFPCPPGQEPDKGCGYGKGFEKSCRSCAQGTFKDSYGFGSCETHMDCASLRKIYIRLGTPMTDAACGHCLPGHYASVEESSGLEKCLPCSSAPLGTAECSAINAIPFRSDETNEDTIGVLVRLITEKKENAAALQELLKEHELLEGTASDSRADITGKNASERLVPLLTIPKLCKHHHVHTVQTSATPLGSSCTRCSQKKWPELLLNPPIRNAAKSVKVGTRANRPGEITILSIGRFRVTQIPEQKQNVADGKSDLVDITCDGAMDQKLLGSVKCPKYTAGQQEVGD